MADDVFESGSKVKTLGIDFLGKRGALAFLGDEMCLGTGHNYRLCVQPSTGSCYDVEENEAHAVCAGHDRRPKGAVLAPLTQFYLYVLLDDTALL